MCQWKKKSNASSLSKDGVTVHLRSMFSEKVYVGLEHAPPAFELRARLQGPNGNNVDYIKSETGASVYLKSDKADPMHLLLLHARAEPLASARSLALNLIETVKQELAQWMSQTIPPPSNTAPPPSTDVEQSITPSIIPANTPAMSMANSPVVSMRPQTVLQFMPQQQYILNQDGSQLIPLIQQGQVSQGNFTQLAAFPQHSMGNTQFVDANMQPVSVAQFRFAPNSMPYIQNGLAISQVSLANQDTTTVSYSSLLPVSSSVSTPSGCPPSVHATQAAPVAGQKVQWSSDKSQESKQEVKYHYQLQSGDQVQFMPANSQTIQYIPYQQLQELTSGQQGSGLHQIVSISPAGAINSWPGTNTSLPLQLQSLQQPNAAINHNLLQLNQKPAGGNTSVINLWPAQSGQNSLPTQLAHNQQIIGPNGQMWSAQQLQGAIAASQGTPTNTLPTNKNTGAQTLSQDARGQKRLSDGSPSSQLQLRPIAPAGSQSGHQEKAAAAKDTRTLVWSSSAVRENAGPVGNQITMSVKGSTSQVSLVSATSAVQSSTSTVALAPTQDSSSKPSKESSLASKADPGKGQSYVQMYTVSPNMSQMQNITQIPSGYGQTNQMYIMPSSQAAALQNGGLQQNMMGQTLPIGQGMSMIQPNQLSLPQGMSYNTVPFMQLNVPPNVQYISQGLNVSNPAMANQQIINQSMLQNLQGSPTHASQYNQTSVHSMNANAMQYNATGVQSSQTQQFVVPSSQAQAAAVPATQYSAAPAQYATQPASFMLQPQQSGSAPQYTQLTNATNLNQTAAPTNDARNSPSQQNSFVPGNATPQTQQSVYAQGASMNPQNAAPQTFATGTPANTQAPPGAVTAQTYPNANSPSVQQGAYSAEAANQTAGNPQGNYAQAASQNLAQNTYQSGQNVPAAQYNGNQYRPWVRPRFSAPPGAQYGMPSALPQPAPLVQQTPQAQPAALSQPAPPSQPAVQPPASNGNYWQYS